MSVAFTFSKRTIRVGLGHLGFRVVSHYSSMSDSVMVIKLDPKANLVKTVQMLGVPIIQDDAPLQSTLESAGVDPAKTIVLCTQIDSLNLLVALKTRSLNPENKIVMRISDDDFAKSLETQFGSKAIGTQEWLLPRLQLTPPVPILPDPSPLKANPFLMPSIA